MNFKKISNQELENKLITLVRQERKMLHLIILHIREIDNRQIYLERARPSLFDYLTKDLGYSPAAAQRRIEAARLIKEVPQLAEKIESGAINLSQIGEVSRAFKQKLRETATAVTTKEKQNLVSQIENQNIATTQSILARELDLTLLPPEKKQIQKDESVHLQITLSKEQYARLQQCKDLAAHILLQNKKGVNISEVIDVLAEQFLKARTGKKSTLTQTATDAEVTFDSDQPLKKEKSTLSKPSSVTQKARREIFEKYDCCQYVDKTTGKICGTRFAIETDHLISQWAGGDHTQSNLTTLCSAHNKFKYRKEAAIGIYR